MLNCKLSFIVVFIICLFDISFIHSQQIVNLPALNAKCDPAIVKIHVLNEKGIPQSLGSGCIISSDGICLTNYHVLEGARFAEVILSDGSKYPIESIIDYSDDNHADLVKFKINTLKTLPFILLRESKILKGESVFALGYPDGFSIQGGSTLSTGIISGYRSQGDVNLIQTTTPITHGSSGGGLFDKNGLLCGITTGTFAREIENRHANLNKVVPISEVLKLNRKLNLSLKMFFNELLGGESIFAQALDKMDKREFSEAAVLFGNYLEVHPSSPKANFRFAESVYFVYRESAEKKHSDLAINYFYKALELDSTYFLAKAQMAKCFLMRVNNGHAINERQELNNAIYLAETCYHTMPKNAFSWYLLASVYGHQKIRRFEDALVWYQKCYGYHKENKNSEQVLNLGYEIGICITYLDRYSEALMYLRSSLNQIYETREDLFKIRYKIYRQMIFCYNNLPNKKEEICGIMQIACDEKSNFVLMSGITSCDYVNRYCGN